MFKSKTFKWASQKFLLLHSFYFLFDTLLAQFSVAVLSNRAGESYVVILLIAIFSSL